MADQSEQEEKLEPLVIFYDSEASDGNVYYGDVIEIAATCHPGVVVGSFERLINTKQRLGSFAIQESGITEDLLQDKPFISEVIVEFLDWIDEMVVLAQKKNNTSYFPVLCAHGGYQFDFLILFANLERKGISHSKLSDSNIHFADSFLFCQQLQQDDTRCLQNTRLSIDGLFHNFFPRHTIKGRHRAMGDVKAMVKIFTQTPLKNVLHLMSVSTTLERVKYFVSQSSAKEQQQILEEKMSSLDACSRSMYSKRLLKGGLTYDLLKIVFQNCSSYMDFWQTLKKIGIERKVAKHFTSQFSAMGLENQGSLGFALNAAMQNGSLSNGSSRDSNGHSDRGNLVSSNDKSETSGPSRTSNSNRKTNPSRDKGVLGTMPAERATSSSRAFEERPLDYAVTSSADERPKAYAMPRSAKQLDNKKDASENSRVASDIEQSSCPGVEPTTTDSVLSENGNSRDLSVCNGDENWDSEIESSVRRGHFILQFSEVIPSSIVQEDVCSSSGGSSAVQHTDARESYSKRAPTHPDRNQEKRIVGKKKELVSHSKRNDDRLSIGQGKKHEHSHAKKSGKSSLGFDKCNKNTDKQDTSVTSVHDNMSVKEINGILDKSKAAAVSSENGKQGTTISSARKEETKQVNLNKCAGNMPKVADATISKTLKSSMEEVAPKELDLESVKTKRKASSKKKPSSVTFVEPVDVPPVDPSSDVSTGNVHMTTVYVGDVPILVPVKKHSAPCQDDLDQPAYENKEQVEVTGNGKISTDETTMSRKEGDTLNKEGPISFPTVAEGMSLSKESEDGHSVSRQVEDDRSQKMDDSEESKTSASDAVKPTSTMESFSSSAYETSDTGSNLDYNNEPGSAPVNHCPAGDISNAHDFRKQVSSTIEQVNQPTAPIIEENPSCDMENASNIEHESENLCDESENQGDILVDNSGEVDISPDMATQEQMNGYPEGPWASSDVVCPNPNMYPMPPPQYPFQMPYPTAMPSVYGFYPRLPHMMSVIPGPRPVPYPTMPFASQGMIPFGGFPPRIHMPMPMFQPTVYPPAQQGPPLNLEMSEQEAVVPQTSRSSPEVLGIPGNRIHTSEHQNNKTPGISNVSFSTSSDDHSARSSPYPVDDSSGKTTPLTTPHRSPVDEFSPGALSSSDKGEQGYHGRKEYRKETRPARYHTDERSRRPNRNGPWNENNYRDKVNKKYLPEKASRGDRVDRPESKSRESDGAQDERKKTKKSDNPFIEDKHSSGHVKESSDQDKKLNSSSPKRSSKPAQSEQLTPPRREAKSGHGTWKHSPKTPKSARFDLASPRSSPKKSRGELLTPPRTEEKDHSPKTLYRDTRNERSQQEPGEERHASSDYTPSQQTAPTFSKANQGSLIKSSQNESHKSEKSDGINKRGAKDLLETQKSSRASNVRAPPRTHPSGDGDPHSTTSKSSSESSARASLISDKKHDKFISSEKEPKQWNQEGDCTATPSPSLNKERKRYPSKSHITDSENVKWPQSALASQKFNDPPKPQRDLSSRTRRARESYSSGSERDKRVESNRRGVISRRNEDVKEQSKAACPTTGERKTTDSIPASGNVTSKEPFSASGNDFKKKSLDTTQKNARENQKSVNYRDVPLEKQETRAQEKENSSSRTNRILSSDRVIKDESTGSVEPKTLPEAANTAPTKEPLPESGPMKKPRGTPHSGDQEKTVGKECRNERENTTKQPSKETRGGNTTRGSGMSREPTPRNSTRNVPRNRHYHSNNNNNIQSRNKANKS